jgi:hypothetical protein
LKIAGRAINTMLMSIAAINVAMHVFVSAMYLYCTILSTKSLR